MVNIKIKKSHLKVREDSDSQKHILWYSLEIIRNASALEVPGRGASNEYPQHYVFVENYDKYTHYENIPI